MKFFEEDQVFHGRIVGLDDFIAFEGNDLKQLEENFKTEVDQYLDLNSLEAQFLGSGWLDSERRQQMRSSAQRARIKSAVLAEFPHANVEFDDLHGPYIRFVVVHPVSGVLTKASPELLTAEIECMDDTRLRHYIRALCGH